MQLVIWLVLLQGLLGAFDTIYFHEWVAKLPINPKAAPELQLHATRDFIYAVIFATLPFFECRGFFAGAVTFLLVAEIIVTLWDFAVEPTIRNVQPGERVTHAIIGINYGAILVLLAPFLIAWSKLPTELVCVSYKLPDGAAVLLLVMCCGVLFSGLRDLFCGLGFKAVAWPWR